MVEQDGWATAGITAPPVWRATLSGVCASLVGIGMARFAYAPLLPAIIQGGWFDSSSAAYLGAVNLAGYLAGALLAGPLARRGARPVLRGAMLLAAVTFFACAWPLGFAWFFAWRGLSGVAGGVLMVLAAPAILPRIAPARRGLVSGIIFTGVGLGIVASGTLVPLLLRQGLAQTWLGLGMVALLLTILAWGGWPLAAPPLVAAQNDSARLVLPVHKLRAIYAVYGLNAFGLVPHMIFLVDFVARFLHQGLTAGAFTWVVFGLGAVVGPALTGSIADRIGFASAMRWGLLVEAIAVALPALTANMLWLAVSSLVMGAFTAGVVPLTLGRTRGVLRQHPDAQKAAWATATASFAVMQALGAYALSFLLANGLRDERLLFALAASVMLVALGVDRLVATSDRPVMSSRPGMRTTGEIDVE